VSGLPGAGTSTVARDAASALGLEHVDAGMVFRSLAADQGMSLADFGTYARDHLEFDVELDARMAERARQGACLLEGRLTGWVVTLDHLDAVRVWIACPEAVRAARVARREGVTATEALEQNRARQAVDAERYQRAYGIDLDDLAPYDLVLDSEREPPPALVEAIVAAVGARGP
jgi:cytidylate kinase